MFTPKSCADCGPHATFHRLEYTWAAIEGFTRFWMTPIERAGRALQRLKNADIADRHRDAGYVLFLRTLAKLGLVTLVSEPGEHENHRTHVLRVEAAARGIDFQEFRFFGTWGNHFIASWRGQEMAFDAIPRPHNGEVKDWMDDKNLMRRAFAAADVPIANGGACMRLKTALDLFDRLEKPVICKPQTGSRSRHTTIHIQTREELKAAFAKAKCLSPWVLVEEELAGSLYRGTVIGGKMVAVLRRDAPCVTGDGAHTVRDLLELENARPVRHAGVFEPIPVDADTEAELRRQEITWESVPNAGRAVILNPKFGRGQGSLNEDVTEAVHPDNILLLEDAARVVDDPVIGMDFFMRDISRSWKEQIRVGIIECNSAPFIDIHSCPYKGEPRNVAGPLWELVFPGSGK